VALNELQVGVPSAAPTLMMMVVDLLCSALSVTVTLIVYEPEDGGVAGRLPLMVALGPVAVDGPMVPGREPNVQV
jgi:hypothetical protein